MATNLSASGKVFGGKTGKSLHGTSEPTLAPNTDFGVLQANSYPDINKVQPKAGAQDKTAKTIADLQAIVNKRGAGDPIGAQANQLAQQLQTDPSLVSDSGYQEALVRIGRAVSQADAGGNPTALAKDAAPIVNAVRQTVAQRQSTAKTQEQVDLAKQTAADNKNFVDQNVTPRLQRLDNAAGAAGELDRQALGQQTQSRDTARDALNNLVGQQQQLASGYNATGNQNAQNYASQQNALNSQDQAGLSRYMSETDPLMNQLQARGWGADVQNDAEGLGAQRNALGMAQGAASGSLDYQAAQARSNAGDVARQTNSYGQLQDVGNGSLDYNAAQYTSNGYDVQNQENALNRFNQIGGGSLNYSSAAGLAEANEGDIINQRGALSALQNDRLFGDKDQRDAYNTIKSRTGVEATAQEAYLAEVARRKFESDDSSRRAAVMEDQAQRGLRSGSAEIANQVLGQQQTAADRSMAEMGLQANAVGRAQQYTGMQADQANAMRGSSQQGLGLESQLSTNMRNASFDESYKRGVGFDQASRDNQGTQLAGYQMAGQQSNALRGANDAVGTFNVGQQNNALQNNQSTRFGGITNAASVATSMRNASDSMAVSNAGFTNNALANNQSTRSAGITQSGNMANSIRSANDAIATFNKTGSQTAQQYQDTYAQNEAIRVGGLAGNRAAEGRATTQGIGVRNESVNNSNVANNDTNYARDRTSISDQRQNVGDIYGMDTDVNNMTADVGQRNFNRTGSNLTMASNVANTRAGTSGDIDTIIRSLQNQKGDIEAKRAEDFF